MTIKRQKEQKEKSEEERKTEVEDEKDKKKKKTGIERERGMEIKEEGRKPRIGRRKWRKGKALSGKDAVV